MAWSRHRACAALGRLAVQALLEEARLTPKPGLVDGRGSGAHTDMTLSLLEHSAQSLQETFEAMALVSWLKAPDAAVRRAIGRLGREGEALMLSETGGVNTHRGAIWTLGLLTAASASCGCAAGLEDVFARAGHLAQMTDDEAGVADSHGRRVRRLYGLTGAREEAERGFPHIARAALPELKRARRAHEREDECRVQALLAIMTTLSDTCIASRGGLIALRSVQADARGVLAAGAFATESGRSAFAALDANMIERGISPGGAADLLAGTLFAEHMRLTF